MGSGNVIIGISWGISWGILQWECDNGKIRGKMIMGISWGI